MLLMSLEAVVFSIAAYRFWRLPFGVGVLCYASATILVLYASDFVGVLQQTSWSIHALAGVLAVILLLDGIRSKCWTLLGRASIRDGVLLVSAVFLVVQIALYCSQKTYSSWDEFSHWGTVIRVIYEANSFHLSPNPLYFQDYPPGLALFSYHVQQLSGYSEANSYFSYSLLILCFAASIFQLAYRVNVVALAFFTMLIWAMVQFWSAGWASVLVDHMLSIFFAGIVGSYFLVRQSNRAPIVLALALGAFTLTKQSASSLALLAAAIISLDVLIVGIGQQRSHLAAVKGGLLRGLGLCAGLLVVTIAVPFTWQHYVSSNGLTQGWGSYSPYGGLAKLLQCCTSEREVTVATAFFDAMVGGQPSAETGGALLAIAWRSLTNLSMDNIVSGSVFHAPGLMLLALALGSALLVALSRTRLERVRNVAVALLMMAGAAGYAISLLSAYLYAFSDYEARALASFDRFMSVYILGWTLALAAMLFQTMRGWTGWRVYLLPVAGMVLLIAVWPQILLARPILSQGQLAEIGAGRVEVRDKIQAWSVPQSRKIPAGSKLFILWPGSNGFEFWLVKYEFLPHVTNLDCWAPVPSLPKEFIQQCVEPQARLQSELSDFDFVVVGDGLARLRADYPGIFPAEPAGPVALFRVDKSNGFRLMAVEP